MYTRILLVFMAIAMAGSVSSTKAQSICDDLSSCIQLDFSSGVPSQTYDFGPDGSLTVRFDTVLAPFTLAVYVTHPFDSTCVGTCTPQISLDPTEFPSGTVCVNYPTNPQGTCDQYNFLGNVAANPDNGLPMKNVQFKGLITLTLTYSTGQTVHLPAFGHAPGDAVDSEYTENILTSYSDPSATFCPDCIDPTMGGKTPGISSVIALDEPLTGTETLCSFSAQPLKSASGQNPLVEVSFQLFSNSSCTGTPLKDKTASLSVASTDASLDFLGFAPLINGGDSNKFHWDGKTGMNVQDINTQGLTDGTYSATVISSFFSPTSATFCISGGNVVTCP
ncbi:MAG TPA: hypothetical protein VKR59_14570 [Terriglobales bacterium]|nr:hypothetical protein [Terriglobales bacterium]